MESKLEIYGGILELEGQVLIEELPLNGVMKSGILFS